MIKLKLVQLALAIILARFKWFIESILTDVFVFIKKRKKWTIDFYRTAVDILIDSMYNLNKSQVCRYLTGLQKVFRKRD